MIAIVDIDETLADNKHRQHHLEKEPKDWERFLSDELVLLDQPIQFAQAGLLKVMKASQRIIFLTGRNERLRESTFFWLRQHFIGKEMELVPHTTKFEMHMRPNGEYSTATVYKGRILSQLRQQHPNETFLCLDDDQYMWPVYEKMGGIVLRAPHCWEHLFPQTGELEPELHWRK